jgi:hypothetical protein
VTGDEVLDLLAAVGCDRGAWRSALEQRGLVGERLTEALDELELAWTTEGLALPDGSVVARFTEEDSVMSKRTDRDLIARIDAWRASQAESEEARVRIAREERNADPRWSMARALGMRFDEIHEVKSTARGDVAHLHDGTSFILVYDHAPDADGKTGLMQFGGPVSRHSLVPVYAFNATPPPAVPKAEVAPEPPAPDLPASAPLDDEHVLEMFEAELRRIETEIEHGSQYERPIFEGIAGGLRKLVNMRRAAVADRKLRENPEPPDPKEIQRQTAVYRWAQKEMDPKLTPAEKDIEFARFGEQVPSLFSRAMRVNPKNEFDSAVFFFTHYGLPLPEREDRTPEAV